MSSSAEAQGSITLDLGRSCTNACLFCAQAGITTSPRPMQEQLEAITSDVRQGCFVGGEPTLAPDLESWVRAAREAGLTRVGVQTNGAHLDAERARGLRDAGLTEVELTLHAPRADAHDFLTATPGSFERAQRALDAARDAGLGVRIASGLWRSNFRLAPALTAWLAARDVDSQAYFVARSAGRLRGSVARLMPALGMALPHALRAASEGRRAGLLVLIAGAPVCMLGPHQDLALPSPSRQYASTCMECPRRNSCPGVDGDYLERFGELEFSAARAPAAGEPPTQDWRRAFAGIGSLMR